MSSTIKRQSAAVMFTDIAGYTSIMASDEEKALSLLQDKRKILKPLIKQHNGVYVKGTGDGTLSYFDSAYNASKCAKLFQESIYDNKNMNVRVGIHVGDIVFDDGDVYGDGVNVASRLESMSPVGGICVSNTVYDELRNKKEFDGVELGLQSLKGVGRLIEIYGLKGDLLTEPKPSDYQDNKVAVHADDEVPSIAIIPFRNKGKEEDAFYAYGICSDLISDCSSAGLIRVASLERVEELSDLLIEEKAEKLDVRYIATGNLWKMDEVFQLSIELYDTKDKKVIWSDRWEENWNNLTNIKGSLSEGLLKTLDITSKVEKQIITTNTGAYEYYLRGRYKIIRRTKKEDLEIGEKLLRKSIDLDDNLIDAKNMLAFTQPNFETGMTLFESNIKQAKNLKNKLLIANTYNSKGWWLWHFNYFELSIESFINAIKIYKKINVKSHMSNSLEGLSMVFMCLGQSKSALKTFSRAKDLAEELEDQDLLYRIYVHNALFYLWLGEFNKAMELLNKLKNNSIVNYNQTTIAVNHYIRGCIDFSSKNYQNANNNFKEGYEILEKIGDRNNSTWIFAWYILTEVILREVDQKENIQLILTRIDENWLNSDIDFPEINYNLFRIYKQLNNVDKAKMHLTKAYEKLIYLSENIKNKEFKKSFLNARCHNEIIKDWEKLT